MSIKCISKNCPFSDTDHENCHFIDGCDFAVEQPTNADHIRAMSDEELAEMLWKTGRNYRAVCADPVVDHDEQCAELVKWLQQPVEEDDHA